MKTIYIIAFFLIQLIESVTFFKSLVPRQCYGYIEYVNM